MARNLHLRPKKSQLKPGFIKNSPKALCHRLYNSPGFANFAMKKLTDSYEQI